jgi:cyclic di-GMP phosphodiesterase
MRNLSSCNVLVVDDTETNIDILVETLGDDYDVSVAMDGMGALELVKEDTPDLILLDIMMPGMDGYAVCRSLKADKKTRDIPVIFITAKAEMEDELEGFNLGAVDYITKPISPPIVRARVETHLKLKLAQEEMKELLENTLGGSIRVLTDILAIARPEAFSRSVRIKRLVTAMAENLSLPGRWRFELAAMLSQIGCFTLPPETLDKLLEGKTVSEEEQALFRDHPEVGAELLAHIPRLENVAEMIRLQNRPSSPEDLSSCQLPRDIVRVGAQLLRVAVDFDRHLSVSGSQEDALTRLENSDTPYIPFLVESLRNMLGLARQTLELRTVTADELRSGMVLDGDVYATSGTLLAASGTELSAASEGLLRRFVQSGKIVEPFHVLAPRG